MALSLQEIIQAKLEQLGGKTPYWLATEIGYEPKNISGIMNGKRALPPEYVARLMRALGIEEDSAEGRDLTDALGLARAKLKEDVAPTIEALQKTVHRLTQQLERTNRVVEQQRGQLGLLREQRETASSKIRDLTAQIAKLGEVIARFEKLEANRRAERQQR